MKKFLIFMLIIPFLGCSKNNQAFIDFNCPRIFFASEDRVFIDNGNSPEDVHFKAELNNFNKSKECKQKDEVVIIPVEVLIIAQPMDNFQNTELNIPIYISLLDKYDNLLENQYFLISGEMKTDQDGNLYKETDITDRLEVVTRQIETSQIVIGFMLSDDKRDLLN